MMSSPSSASQNINVRPRENILDGNGAHHNQNHAILRVSSAHGPRDSVQHLQNHYQSPVVQGQKSSMQPLPNPPYPNQQQGRNTADIIAPPMYQQAISSINNNEFGKFSSTRKSPESRAVQAVPPFGVRENVPNSIPDECQVVKQLVREVVANQLITSSNSVQNQSGPNSVAPNQNIQLAVEAYVPPPAYNVHQRLQPQQPNSQQQQQQPNLHKAPIHMTVDNHGQQSAAHPLLLSSGGGNGHQTNNANLAGVPLSPRENTTRMSLSHPDLTRLQNFSFGPANHQLSTKMHPLLAAQAQQHQPTVPGIETSVYEMSNVPIPSDIVVPSGGVHKFSNMPSLSLGPARFYEVPSTESVALGYGVGQDQRQTVQNFGVGQEQRQTVQSFDAERGVTARMLNQLAEENKSLRYELEGYIKKTFKLQQLELQYQKVHREYEELVRKRDKREQLEEQMQKRMQREFARLNEINSQLNDQLEAAVSQMTQYHLAEAEDSELRHEITKREIMITQLVAQNKDLIARKENQEKELQEQEATLEAQRGHISILDKALINAQEKNLKLEEEVKKKNSYMQRCEQLQQMVAKLQDSGQKREDVHKRNVANLQKELTQLQIAKKENQKSRSANSNEADEILISKLKREIQEKDEQIFNFQHEAMQWQNLYYEETKRRETAVEEAADTKDARIKVLEECCDKADKRIDAALNETKKYSDDLRLCKTRNNELESKNEMLEARLAELEAMKNVLKRRLQAVGGNLTPLETSFDSRNVTKSSLFSLSESSYSGSCDDAKKLLEATRRRCLWMSPSPSRTAYTPKLYQKHNKFTSVDTSFNLDTSKSISDYGSLGRAARRQSSTTGSSNDDHSSSAHHNRTQSSCESYLSVSALNSSLLGSGSSSTMKQREIFSLPTRRSRTKITNAEQGKMSRPRSADDHLLSKDEDDIFKDCTEKILSSEKSETVLVSDKDENKKILDNSAEQLWDV